MGAGVGLPDVGDVFGMPFICSDESRVFCHVGLHPSCVNVGFPGNGGGMSVRVGAWPSSETVPAAPSGYPRATGR